MTLLTMTTTRQDKKLRAYETAQLTRSLKIGLEVEMLNFCNKAELIRTHVSFTLSFDSL